MIQQATREMTGIDMVDLSELKQDPKQALLDKQFQISNLTDRLVQLKRDISFENLGADNDFSKEESIKNKLVEFLEGLIEDCLKFYDGLGAELMEEIFKQIRVALKQLEAIVGEIETRAGQGVHDANYVNQRAQLSDKARQVNVNIHNLFLPFIPYLELEKLKRDFSSFDVDALISEHEAATEEIREREKEIELILENLRSGISHESNEVAKSEFGDLAKSYGDREFNWFLALIASSILLVIAVIYAANASIPESATVQEFAFSAFRRLLYISVSAVFVRISLNKYNTERHLRIIYDHRKSSLNQFQIFENSIPEDDHDAKHSLRLEMARVLFSDPATGYNNGSSKSELNINPVVAAAEKMVPKLGG